MKQRLNFLSKCCDLKLVPDTLKVKPPQNMASQNKTTWKNYVNLAQSTSIINLRFAKKDVQQSLTSEEINFHDMIQNILTEPTNEQKLQLNTFIRNSRKKVQHREKTKYSKKLLHLTLVVRLYRTGNFLQNILSCYSRTIQDNETNDTPFESPIK